ncbi:hypothetical protein FACS1894156_1790 [Bacteroidia bacterium]|nr:hypothetical protein AGMMS4956_10650 [Bacteroidia bacterium]GHU94060.1 hypothetical protein FACS1894156_1790 [Bacteroidia bacterium]
MYFKDDESRLLISPLADKNELLDNIRTGRILVNNHHDLTLAIRAHLFGVKNPEYLANDMLADAKRINSWNVGSGFNSAIKQQCKVVIIDLYNQQQKNISLNIDELSRTIVNRHENFTSGTIEKCYVVWNNKSIAIDRTFFDGFNNSKKNRPYKLKVVEELRKLL